MSELTELEVDEDEAAEQAVVEHEVDEEVVTVEGQPLLARHEAEPLAELEQERFDAVDDRLLKVALTPRGALVETEELQNERLLDHLGR